MSEYRKGGFIVTEVHCDKNEFHKVMDDYSIQHILPIRMNYAYDQDHVPQVERNNRTIQEQVRVHIMASLIRIYLVLLSNTWSLKS